MYVCVESLSVAVVLGLLAFSGRPDPNGRFVRLEGPERNTSLLMSIMGIG